MYWWSKALLGVATTGMLAAGATAFAAGQSGTGTGGFWNQLAADLHMAPNTLRSAIRTVELERFQQYAQAHHLSPQQIAARTDAIRHGPIRVVIGKAPRPWLSRSLHLVISTTADTVHLTPAAVRQDLRQGKTLADIATAQGVSVSTLQNSVIAALQNHVQQLEQAGKLSAAQANALDQRISSMVPHWMNRRIPVGRPKRKAGRDRMGGPWMKPTAQYLGLSVGQLRQDLRKGQSPAMIAVAQGKTAQGLVSALEANLKTRLAEAVQSGRMPASREQQMLSRMDQAIQNWVNRAPGAPSAP